MRNATYIGRVGALAVALGVGFAVLVTPGVALAEEANSSKSSSPDRTALIMGGGTVPTPDDYLVEVIKNQYIEPTHPGQDIEYVPVTAPMEAWPVTGLFRLAGIVFGPPEVWGPGGAGWWPDAPLWKLTGLFDLTLDQAIRAGVANLETAMAAHGNDHLVIYGISEGSLMATAEKRKLAEQYPVGTDAPDIDFVMQGTFNLPNGGLHSRFAGGGLPIGWSFDGPAPTDTQFDTVVINRQYDFVADFPLYPLNLVADLNAFLGGLYVHTYSWDVSLPGPDPTKSPAYQGTHGDTSYYFFETQDLPLLGPLRTLGVPESLIDVVEPFFRVIVELGYDRSISPWEPTPARLIPPLNPVNVVADLVSAIGEGINNALAITGSPAPLSIPAGPAQSANATADATDQGTSRKQLTDTDQAAPQKLTIDTDQVASQEQVPDTDQAAPQKLSIDTHQAASQERVTVTGQAASREQVTDTGQAASREQASDIDEPTSKTVSTSKPAKQADTPATHRPVVRDTLRAFGQRFRGPRHHGDADAPTTQVPAVGNGSATDGPSSGGGSAGDGSAGRDADGS